MLEWGHTLGPIMTGWWNKTLVALFGRRSHFFNSLLMLFSNFRIVLLQVRLAACKLELHGRDQVVLNKVFISPQIGLLSMFFS